MWSKQVNDLDGMEIKKIFDSPRRFEVQTRESSITNNQVTSSLRNWKFLNLTLKFGEETGIQSVHRKERALTAHINNVSVLLFASTQNFFTFHWLSTIIQLISCFNFSMNGKVSEGKWIMQKLREKKISSSRWRQLFDCTCYNISFITKIFDEKHFDRVSHSFTLTSA